MKTVLPALALALCSPALWAEGVALPKSVQASFEEHCLECHDAETKKGGLDLEQLGTQFREPAQFEAWLKVHDRIRAGEMPPKKKARPPQGDLDTITSWLNAELTAADRERQTKDVRVGVRRLSRVEFENTLRDLLGLPGLRVQASLPADGKSHGFDRGPEALDFSFVHLDSYLTAVDNALLAATPSMIEQPAVATHHWRPQEDNSIALLTGQKEAIGLIGMMRDETFVATYPNIQDDEPKSTAVGVFRHGDADFRYGTGRFTPKLGGFYRIRISGYSFGWDGLKVVPTQKHGAVSFGVFAQALNLGMVDLPPNRPGVGEITVWLDQSNSDGVMWTPESCERLRDYAYGARKHVIGPREPRARRGGRVDRHRRPAQCRLAAAEPDLAFWRSAGGEMDEGMRRDEAGAAQGSRRPAPARACREQRPGEGRPAAAHVIPAPRVSAAGHGERSGAVPGGLRGAPRGWRAVSGRAESRVSAGAQLAGFPAAARTPARARSPRG